MGNIPCTGGHWNGLQHTYLHERLLGNGCCVSLHIHGLIIQGLCQWLCWCCTSLEQCLCFCIQSPMVLSPEWEVLKRKACCFAVQKYSGSSDSCCLQHHGQLLCADMWYFRKLHCFWKLEKWALESGSAAQHTRGSQESVTHRITEVVESEKNILEMWWEAEEAFSGESTQGNWWLLGRHILTVSARCKTRCGWQGVWMWFWSFPLPEPPTGASSPYSAQHLVFLNLLDPAQILRCRNGCSQDYFLPFAVTDFTSSWCG